MDKYGFVYIWYDCGKSKVYEKDRVYRYYVGCHWGTDFDGYVCSSSWMRDAYKKRPQDFKRRILETNILSKEETVNAEHKWLSLIKKEELGKRYYNLNNQKFSMNYSSTSWNKNKPSWNKDKHLSDEHKANLSKSHTGKSLSQTHKENIGKSMEGREISWADKISAAQKGKPRKSHSQHTRLIMSEKKVGKPPNNKGKPWSPERRAKYKKRFNK